MRAAIALGELDGERLLVWSRPGTPFTDNLVALCAQAGARVTPVASPVVGMPGVQDLASVDAVAVRPEGTQVDPSLVSVPLEGSVTLPLLALRLPDGSAPAAERLVALLGG